MLNKFTSLVTKIYLLLAVVSLLTFNARADVAVDSSGSGGAFSQTGVPSLTWNHSVAADGSNRVLYVGVSTTSDAASSTIFPILCNTIPALCSTNIPIPTMAVNRVITVEYNDVAMQRVGSQISPDFQYVLEIFRLVNPSTGSHPVEVDLVDGLSTNAVGGSVSFTGADEPATQTFYSNSGGNSNPSLLISGETNRRGIALGVVATSPNAIFITDPLMSGQDSQYVGRTFFSNSYDVGKGSTKNANPSATFNWNLTNTTNISWATGGVIVRSFAATASPASIGGRVQTKSGEPIANVSITLQNLQTGEVFRTNTNAKGFYSFENLPLINLYQIKAYNNFHTFSPNDRILNLTESLEGVDFQALRRNRKQWFIR